MNPGVLYIDLTLWMHKPGTTPTPTQSTLMYTFYFALSQRPLTRSAATGSTTSSHDRRHSTGGRHLERNRHPVRSETEPHGRHANNDLSDVAHPRHRHDVVPHLESSHLNVTPCTSRDHPDGTPRPVFSRSEPRIHHHPHISQSDSGRSAQSDSARSAQSDSRRSVRLGYGRSAQPEYGGSARPDRSLSPSPASLRPVSTRQPLKSLSKRQAPGVRAASTELISNSPPSPPETYPNDPVLGDVFDLDESLVLRRSPDCDRTINFPPRNRQGSQGRWYFVCCGRKVGIFNEW